MWAPGIVGVSIGLMLLIAVKDSPEAIGYPPVEIVKDKKVQLDMTLVSCCACILIHGLTLYSP